MKVLTLPNPTEYQIEQCRLFAKHVLETNEAVYKQRGSESNEKIEKDIFYGRLAECMVYNYILSTGRQTSAPDFTIFDGNGKTFLADLTDAKWQYHVKTCDDESSFPNSWLFQKHDPLVKDPQDNDLLCLCVLKKGSSYMYFGKANEVKFEEPKLDRIKPTKVAVYEESLNK